MTWQTDTPKIPGWYWVIHKSWFVPPLEQPVAKIVYLGDGGYVYLFGSDEEDLPAEYHSWFGPLLQPPL
jgi:hypothetical protein